jgi:hypothetical protein
VSSQVHLVAGDPEALLGHQLQLLDLRLANATAVLSLEVGADTAAPACSAAAMQTASQRPVPGDVGCFLDANVYRLW